LAVRARLRCPTRRSSDLSPLPGGVRLQSQTYAREAPHLKHVATMGLLRARRRARLAGYDDALFTDEAGRISEGSLWNIGFIEGRSEEHTSELQSREKIVC